MKKKSIVLGILAGLFLVIIIGLIFLPSILSSDFAKAQILRQANQRLPGTLHINKLAFHWFSGIEAGKISYDNRRSGLRIDIPELKNDRGLLHFMRSLNNVGTVDVKDPVFYLYPLPPSPEPPSESAAPAAKPKKAAPAVKPAKKPTIPAFGGQFNFSNGSVRSVDADGSEKIVITDVELNVDAVSLEQPLKYHLDFTSGDGSGSFSAAGTMAISPDDPLNLEALQAKAEMHIKNWEVRDVLTILAQRGDYPSGNGRLNADLNVTGSPADNLNIQGRLSLDTLKLWGGLLGSDKPSVKKIAVDLDASGNRRTLTLKQFSFQSSLANGSARGQYSEQGKNQLTAKADMNLAEIFTQFPETLNLRKGTKITKGQIVLAAEIETTHDAIAFDSNARIDQLSGINDGKKISWNKPVAVNARGEKRAGRVWLENFSLRSAFLNGDGRGDLNNMRINLSADLQTALQELKKFIDLKGWHGTGALQANLQMKEQTQQLRNARLKLTINDFELNRNRSVILPKQNVNADLVTDVAVGESLEHSKIHQTALNVQSLLTSGKLTATQAIWNPADPLPNASGLTYNGSLNLKQLASLLKNFGALPPNIQLSGSSKIHTDGSSNGKQVTLSKATVDTQNFIFRQDKNVIKDKRIILKTKGKLNPNTKSLYLSPLEISGTPGTVHIPELAISNWSDIQNKLKTRATANLDLGKLIKAYGDFIQLPEKTHIAGKGRFDLDIDFSNPDSQMLKLKGDISPFKITGKNLPTISEKKVNLDVALKRSASDQALAIENLQLDSRPLFIAASGNIDQQGTKKILDTKGTMAPDFNLISYYLKDVLGPNIKISGKAKKPFQLKMIADENRKLDPLKSMEFTGEFHINSINAYGLEIAPLDIPIRIVNASADAKMHGSANGGVLSLQPIIDLRKTPYMLRIPNNTEILKNADITGEVTEELLGMIHPLFKGSQVKKGRVGLFMKHFKWPLAPEARNEAAFAGTLRLRNVKLKASPMLSGLLSIAKVKERIIKIGDLDIEFVGRNGRIETAPIQLNIGDFPLILSGSVGFDKSMDYEAQIPLGEKLVGKDLSKFLQGMAITVPIRGTASNPEIDKKAAQQKPNASKQKSGQKTVEQEVLDLMQNIFKTKKKK
jgi:hypothetical protein